MVAIQQSHFCAFLTVFLIAGLPVGAAAQDEGKSAPYAQRNGAVEARQAASSGQALKLYSHVFNGRGPGFKTPGLQFCDPRYAPSQNFNQLPDANWQEAYPYSPQQLRRAAEAVGFARAYNLETFRLREREVKAMCPRVLLEGVRPKK